MEAEQLLSGEEQEDDLEESEQVEASDPADNGRAKQRCSTFVKIFFDQLFPPLSAGEEQLSRKRSVAILFTLYTSHIFSSWGDRMWGFSVSLFLALLYPGSLLMPGVYGLSSGLVVTILGTVVGDWVDFNPRMRVAWVTLLSQNALLVAGASTLCLMFYFEWNVCLNLALFVGLSAVTIVMGSLARLATVANTISIEKDWVVVIAGKDENTLAALNANMRRIDLLCKLLAPIVVGVLLEHSGGVVNLFRPDLPADQAGGFVTTLAVAVWNVISFFGELFLLWVVYRMVPALAQKRFRNSPRYQEVEEANDSEVHLKPSHGAGRWEGTGCRNCWKLMGKLATPYRTLVNGWTVYIKQDIALAGLALACLYLTVLGFSGVTSTFFLTQGLTTDYIGLAQGLGGAVGVIGTLAYPFIRKCIGTVRTGIVGLCLQLTMLSFCVVGVFIPGRKATDNGGYYSPNCSSSVNSTLPFPSSGSGHPDSTPVPLETGVGASVILVLVGVIGARFGLWMFDLALSQLVQERVKEEERGVVSGVINSMTANMDMFHYVLVIAAPRPQDFRYLAVISFVMVSTGLLMYALFMRKIRGHFFHCSKLCHKLQSRGHGEAELSVINPSASEYVDDQ